MSEPVGQEIDCAWLLADPGTAPAQRNMRIALEGEQVARLTPLPAAPAGRRRLALPALANAHDHARTFRSATLGAFGQPLEGWLPFLGVLPGMDPYLCAATSFARSLRNGVVELMVHYTRVQGGMPYADEAAAVARAARDVGVRIGFAVALRDRHGIGYADDAAMLGALRPGIRDEVARRLGVKPVAPAQQLGGVDEVAARIAQEGHGAQVDVQYGPTGVQWCSTPLLEAIAQASADTGRRVHMHLLETQYQRAWADEAHPEGIVHFLDHIGLLSPRLTLAHCTWARPQELALIAERGVTIAVNTSSNLGLKSGIAPLSEMLAQGCKVAMGLDGMAFDEDDDALREARLAHALHRGWGYEDRLSAAQLWRFASRARLAPGEHADIVLLDWDALDDDALFDDIDPLDLLLARGQGRHVHSVIAAGRRVVDAGRVCGVDEPALLGELRARMRAALAADDGAWAGWRRSVQAMAEDLGPFYRAGRLRGACCG
ncbi:amidohydrolase family protein [Xenophilus arseniciresistens]|uniref:Amidohydrolase family protein n=1 Tax=Xenophilus arseniciresistens TaxID=1283306 RepID=A0AAE3NAY4_9BURK|nr:amidohydrolase family protein [Xenophilus arseniciresistens]MDA7418291.1 amidohydrolase family protein [Xenophilus arseniciresistens]